MVHRRRFKLAYLLGSLLLLATSLHPPTAYSAPGDPPSGSPAGAVYQLPLEQGRSDAAPKGGGGTSAGTAAGAAGVAAGESGGETGSAGSGSLYRTENNFGSSSRVPGLAASGGAPEGATARVGSGNGVGTGAGGSGAGTPGAAIVGGAIAAETSDTGNTSVAAGAILLGAIVLLAAAVGLLSRRFSS